MINQKDLEEILISNKILGAKEIKDYSAKAKVANQKM